MANIKTSINVTETKGVIINNEFMQEDEFIRFFTNVLLADDGYYAK